MSPSVSEAQGHEEGPSVAAFSCILRKCVLKDTILVQCPLWCHKGYKTESVVGQWPHPQTGVCSRTAVFWRSAVCQTVNGARLLSWSPAWNKKISGNETLCGCFTLKHLFLDYEFCIVTWTNPLSPFPYHHLSEFKYWPQKTSDFFFLRWLYPDWWYYFINDLALNFALCWHQRWDS